MKLAIILFALLLVGCASAEREYIAVDGFNVSFEISEPHQVNATTIERPGPNEWNDTVLIETFGGKVEIDLDKYNSPEITSMGEFMIDMPISHYIDNGGRARYDEVQIDGQDGRIGIWSDDAIYRGFYFPGYHDGMAPARAYIESSLSFYDTADFLRSLHIEVLESPVQNATKNS
jgi:hypothetical protein